MPRLSPISIGPLTIAEPVVLAPMTGVTDLPFRKLVKRFGAGLTVTEMIASEAMVRETRQSVQKAAWDSTEEPVSMQLAGCEPRVMVADEPTTALDVTIQAQILDLLGELKDKMGMAIMLITHAMGVVAESTQRVVVMYAGKVVEEARVEDLFASPRHPYTQGLIRSIPRLDSAATGRKRLEAIPGSVPFLLAPKPGCRFAPRCPYARAECTDSTPALREIAPGHRVACIL